MALGAGAAVLLKPKLVQNLNASDAAGADDEEEHLLVNWSGTHECRPRVLAQPESLKELEALVADAHAAGAQPETLKPVVAPALGQNLLALAGCPGGTPACGRAYCGASGGLGGFVAGSQSRHVPVAHASYICPALTPAPSL